MRYFVFFGCILILQVCLYNRAAFFRVRVPPHPSSLAIPPPLVSVVTHDVLRLYMPCSKEWSWGERLCTAFMRFAPPHIQWVSTPAMANVVVQHVDFASDVERTLPFFDTHPVVIVQHSLLFGEVGVSDYAKLWNRALLAASFQPLHAYTTNMRFLHMPWGADEDAFAPSLRKEARQHVVVIVGVHGGFETHQEVIFAAAHMGMFVHHVGPAHANMCRCTETLAETSVAMHPCRKLLALRGKAPCDWYRRVGSSDAVLVEEMQRAQYVSALRKFEGFEMVGIEALFCGARPLVYDIRTYDWYRDHAITIRSQFTEPDLLEELKLKLSQPFKPIDDTEMRAIRARFSWRTLVPTFTRRIECELHARGKKDRACD